ncbi:MAG: hypothetical protein NC299_09880 [Lachnospiraceae bacterium]|nr:hypothetical protein [Lachnospiraceae bacterium]
MTENAAAAANCKSMQTFAQSTQFPDFNFILQRFQIFTSQNRKNLQITANRLQKAARQLQNTAK